MVGISRRIEKINDDIRTAGQSFLGNNLEDMIRRFSSLSVSNLRNQIIHEYYLIQNGFFDKNEDGTRTRVNAAIRIIRAGQVEYALMVIGIYGNGRVDSNAILKARETLTKIKNGEFKLPNLQ